MAETSPMMLQALCYTATDFRLQLASLICSEGVADVTGGSLLVTTGGAGLDLSVAQGAAFIDSDAADQGMYSVYNDAPETVTATAADATNPRIDQVIATVNDSQIVGVDDDWVLSVLAGTPTAGATLTNLNGATALPDRSIRLAYVLVPATFVGPFVNATHILDARQNYSVCSAFPYVSLEPAAATSLPDTGSYTQPTMATVVHNDPAFFTVSGATITVVEAGLYDVQAANTIAPDADGVRGAQLLINNTNLPNASPNGSEIAGAFQNTASASVPAKLTMNRENIFLAAGSTIKAAYTINGAGAALNTAAAGPLAHLTVRKVG